MKILRRLLNNTNFLIGSSLTLLYYSRYVKYEIKKVAETETVNNALHYVAVRAARGEYTRPGKDWFGYVENYFDGMDQAATDYKFFNQVKRRDDVVKIVRPRKPINLIKQSRSEQ